MRFVAGLAFLLLTLLSIPVLAYEANEEQCRTVKEGKQVPDPLSVWRPTTDTSFQEAVKRDCMRVERQAVDRGVSVATIFSERQKAREEYERELAERKHVRELVNFLVFSGISLAVIATVIGFRKKIISVISQVWWRQSKEFRIWIFVSVAWATGAFLRDVLVDSSLLYDEEPLRLLGVMFIPPIFAGSLWFGYRRFV